MRVHATLQIRHLAIHLPDQVENIACRGGWNEPSVFLVELPHALTTLLRLVERPPHVLHVTSGGGRVCRPRQLHRHEVADIQTTADPEVILFGSREYIWISGRTADLTYVLRGREHADLPRQVAVRGELILHDVEEYRIPHESLITCGVPTVLVAALQHLSTRRTQLVIPLARCAERIAVAHRVVRGRLDLRRIVEYRAHGLRTSGHLESRSGEIVRANDGLRSCAAGEDESDDGKQEESALQGDVILGCSQASCRAWNEQNWLSLANF